jgi:hypothetical protein
MRNPRKSNREWTRKKTEKISRKADFLRCPAAATQPRDYGGQAPHAPFSCVGQGRKGPARNASRSDAGVAQS